MKAEQEQYNELAFYTLAHSDPAFIHQNIVDAFAAQTATDWPGFSPPAECGDIRAGDVLAAAPGAERDALIHKWCESVWTAWEDAHQQIAELCEQELGIKA